MRIAALVENFFEDVEYTEPVKAFRDADHTIINIGLRKGASVTGKKSGTNVQIHESIENISVDDFDALFIPGGYSPDRLRAHEQVVSFVRAFMESGKPVFAICHAPQLLISGNVLKGRRVTGWKSIIQDIKNCGAEFIDEPVVEDKNLVSSRGPNDIPAFVQACLRKLSDIR